MTKVNKLDFVTNAKLTTWLDENRDKIAGASASSVKSVFEKETGITITSVSSVSYRMKELEIPNSAKPKETAKPLPAEAMATKLAILEERVATLEGRLI